MIDETKFSGVCLSNYTMSIRIIMQHGMKRPLYKPCVKSNVIFIKTASQKKIFTITSSSDIYFAVRNYISQYGIDAGKRHESNEKKTTIPRGELANQR
ncbi:MAG: hypothetical protein JJE30_01575 [Desulfuromonadales bacterium]|nr:hypothetical protein [Desulfuromonadales bacterium]